MGQTSTRDGNDAIGFEQEKSNFRVIDFARYKKTIDQQKGPVALISFDQQYIYMNERHAKFFGYSGIDDAMKAMAEGGPSKFSPEKQPSGLSSEDAIRENSLATIKSKSGVYSFDWTHKKKDGSEKKVTIVMTYCRFQSFYAFQVLILPSGKYDNPIKKFSKMTSTQYDISFTSAGDPPANPQFEGDGMTLMGGTFSSAVQKYLVLDESGKLLYFYKKKGDSKAEGVIRIDHMSMIRSTESPKCFEITGPFRAMFRIEGKKEEQSKQLQQLLEKSQKSQESSSPPKKEGAVRMKVLIVLAHMNTGKSANHAIAYATKKHLEKNNCEVRLVDLYDINFNPTPGKEDFKKVQNEEFFDYQSEQKYAVENDNFVDELKKQMDHVLWADLMIWQFPMFWFSYPTILKGWIDKVFAYHFVFGGDKTLKAGIMLSITAGGSYEDIDQKFSYGNWGYYKFKQVKPFHVGGVMPFIDGKTEKEVFSKRQDELSQKMCLHLDQNILGEKINYVNISPIKKEEIEEIEGEQEEEEQPKRMKILIILAHMNTGKSVNHALTRRAKEHLESKNCSVRVVDLYAENFDPLPGPNDFKRVQNMTGFFDYQDDQKFAVEHDNFNDQIKKQMDHVEWCDLMIWQFPLFWWSYPTILKGWIDKVFAYHFVFGGGKTLKAGIMLSITSGGNYEDFEQKFSFGNWGYYKFKQIKPFTVGGVFPFIDGKTEEELFLKRQKDLGDQFIKHIDHNILGEKINYVNLPEPPKPRKKVLIILAHMNTGKSVNHALARAAKEHLEKNKCEVRLVDLHAENFNPLPGENDFNRIQNMTGFFDYQSEQKFAVEYDNFSEDVKKQMENVEWCDLMIWQFPLFWWSYPAILKGWIDRVFAYHFVFGGGKTLEPGIMMSITSGGNYEDFEQKFSFGNWGYYKFKQIKPFTVGGVFPFIDGKVEEELFLKRQKDLSDQFIKHIDQNILGEEINYVNVPKPRMKGMVFHKYGGIEEFVTENNILIPEPKKGEVRIKIYSSALNAIDYKVRNGWMTAFLKIEKFPVAIGNDVSGIIDKLGEDIQNFKIGDHVCGFKQSWTPDIHSGTFCEYVCISETAIALKPKEISWQQAAAIPVATLTANQIINLKIKDDDEPGKDVLILGASGGVGVFVVQLSKIKNCRNIICVGSSRNHELLKSLGGTHCIDYKTQNVAEETRKICPDGVDVILDCGTSTKEQLEIIEPACKEDSGSIISISNFFFQKQKVEFQTYMVQPIGSELVELMKFIVDGSLKVPIGGVFSFDQVQEAYRLFEGSHPPGKLIIDIIPTSMKACIYHKYGGPEVMVMQHGIPLLEPKKGEIRVKTYSTAINAADYKVRNGWFQQMLTIKEFPVCFGYDVSGVVEKVGEGVKNFKVGDHVCGFKQQWEPDLYCGTYCEYVVINESACAKKPESVSWQQAAAIPVATLTSSQIVNLTVTEPGKDVLILGASGGVGGFVVQLAKIKNCKNIICVGSSRNHELLKSFGGTHCIDYKTQDIAQETRKICPDGVDVILDCATGSQEQLDAIEPALKNSGKIISISNFVYQKKEKIDFQVYQVQPIGSELEEILKLIVDDRLKVEIGKVYGFDQVQEAFREFETSHPPGKIVIDIIPTSMKACIYHKYGGPEVFVMKHDIPLLEPKKGEIRVKTHCTAINAADYKVRNGWFQQMLTIKEFPVCFGYDVSGVVEKVGEGVKNFKVGDHISGFKQQWTPDLYCGTYCEYVVINESACAKKPESVSWEQAAAIPVATLTANQIVNLTVTEPGKDVLILGASGGVGGFVVQLAKLKKCKNIIVVGSSRNHEFLKSLGGTHCIDYKTQDIAKETRKICPDGVDVILDCATGSQEQLEAIEPALKNSGKIISIANFVYQKKEKIDFQVYQVQPKGDELEEILKLIVDDRIKVQIGKIYGFDQVQEAFREFETSHPPGKMVIKLI